MTDRETESLSEPRSLEDERLHTLLDPHHTLTPEDLEAKITREGTMLRERAKEQAAFDAQRKQDADVALHYNERGLPLPADLKARLAERRPPDVELTETEQPMPQVEGPGGSEPVFDTNSSGWKGLKELEADYSLEEQKEFTNWFAGRRDVQEYVYGGTSPQERADRLLETAISYAGVTQRNEYKKREYESQLRRGGEVVKPVYEQIEVDPRHLPEGE